MKFEYEYREKLSLEKQLEDTTNRSTVTKDEFLKLEQQLIGLKLQGEKDKEELGKKDELITQLRANKAYLEEQVTGRRLRSGLV